MKLLPISTSDHRRSFKDEDAGNGAELVSGGTCGGSGNGQAEFSRLKTLTGRASSRGEFRRPLSVHAALLCFAQIVWAWSQPMATGCPSSRSRKTAWRSTGIRRSCCRGVHGDLLSLFGSSKDESVAFSETDNTIFFQIGHRTLSVRKLVGQFPNYDAIIPREAMDSIVLVPLISWLFATSASVQR